MLAVFVSDMLSESRRRVYRGSNEFAKTRRGDVGGLSCFQKAVDACTAARMSLPKHDEALLVVAAKLAASR
jgi:hypothetical protein